jgi:uncharacterized membrane-anchored protein
MKRVSIFLVLAFCFIVPQAHAQEAASQQADKYTAFLQREGTFGPHSLNLRDKATLNLPEGYVFLPEAPAKKVMERIGNKVDDNFVGLILPAKKDVWFVSIEYEPSGHINDKEAKSWDTDKLLETIRENTNKDNKSRQDQGVAPLEISGWLEKPTYDEAAHRLIWSIAAHDQGVTDTSKNIVNYRMLMLGREGFISMVMVTHQSLIDKHKLFATNLLSNLNFDAGSGYQDFNASTDHIAEYGLAALVAGVAAKKLGLLAILIAFFAKSIKIIIIASVAFFARIRKKFGGLFGKKPEQDALGQPLNPKDSDINPPQ